ncbi:Hsp33 family molecular chaperone HslO [Limibaculum sp. FT325]|uniref:Hsp33 family molecular chaperone HslO n=1 Tax=Thermohalobaculum sediminis TaxID=2939436 RepID=UPI0020C05435|nr:Hsp33 family molecular chaperone HslO [Limibaculum sediminis]MCL5777754.1 Hsp33 family molecular chaperone HslO [Limibaculum sediminis]
MFQTQPTPRPGDDTILPFGLDRSAMRGRVARLDGTLDRILTGHNYPAPVAALVAEAVVLTALIGQAVKLRWKFSLQIRAEGAIRLVATDYFAPERPGEPARMRAYAGFDPEGVTADGAPFGLLGAGVFGVTIDQGADMRPYQGITPLTGGSLSACAETYFAQSEQLATRFHVEAAEEVGPGGARAWRAGGLMLQQLPSAGGHAPDAPSGEEGLMTADDVAAMGAREEDWSRAAILMATVETHELIGPHVTMERLLYRLFHEETPRVHAPQPVAFGCTCSAERVERALAQYSAKDIGHMTTPDGRVTADCQFCGAHYEFAPETLGFEATARRDA